jgi:hypothetical protein
VENSLRALDDDTHVSVLINPSVTRDAFSPPGFPTRHWAVLLVFFCPQQTLVELLRVVLDAKQYRAGTVDQHATQIDIAALADAVQLLLAPGGVPVAAGERLRSIFSGMSDNRYYVNIGVYPLA